MSPWAARSNRKVFVVGFDFGTHSTKVAYRQRGEPEGHLITFDRAAEGYPTLASPSIVRCHDDRLYFGSEALHMPGGRLYRSLKVNVLLGDNQPSMEWPAGLDSRATVAAYFAWAFQRLRERIPELAESRAVINVAAPMSHFENLELKRRYLQIIQAAWELSFTDRVTKICQGVPVSRVRERIVPLVNQPVPGREERLFAVLPETIAPVVSLSMDPFMEPGMYMIIDTGAGTTEMSVFHVDGPDGDQRVVCYCDETMLLGGNDLQLAERCDKSERADQIARITQGLTRQYRKVWYRGYQVDCANLAARRRWKELKLVLSGGGTRHDAVATQLEGTNPMQPWPERETDLRVERHVPRTLEEVQDMDEGEASLYAVANGLAVERVHWPTIYPQDDVEPLAPTAIPTALPEAYWYLER